MISDWIPVIAAVLGTGGLLGGVVLLLKVRPEAGQIVVSAAQDVVLIQKGAIGDLRDQVKELQRQVVRLGEIRQEVESLRAERTVLSTENVKLRNRVKHLEDEVATLKLNGRNELGQIEKGGG